MSLRDSDPLYRERELEVEVAALTADRDALAALLKALSERHAYAPGFVMPCICDEHVAARSALSRPAAPEADRIEEAHRALGKPGRIDDDGCCVGCGRSVQPSPCCPDYPVWPGPCRMCYEPEATPAPATEAKCGSAGASEGEGTREAALRIEPDPLVNAIMGSDLIRLYGINHVEIARFHAKDIARRYEALRPTPPPAEVDAKRRAVIDAAKAWRANPSPIEGITPLVDAVDALLAAERAERGGKGGNRA